MSPVKIAAISGLAALALAGCGTSVKPLAGTPPASSHRVARGKVDDPRGQHLKCMQQHKLPAVKVGQTGIQVGPLPAGPTIEFEPTPGAAQQLQITGQVQSAEVIGSALLYPNQAPDGRLKLVEDCLATGVQG